MEEWEQKPKDQAGLLLSSRALGTARGEEMCPLPGLLFPALTTFATIGDPDPPGRPRSMYRSELLLLGGPPPRSHDITSRPEGALLLERKSSQ